MASRDLAFAALADPTRRGIFERLARHGEQTVGGLTHQAGVSQPATSKHLGVLKRAGLVRHRRSGRQAHYSVRPNALAPLIDWMSHYRAFWNAHVDRLEQLLDRIAP
jgi:DNA-binding transcriptional ArsR family regulator